MARAGRKRKFSAVREANGKPSRAGRLVSAEQETMDVAKTYRENVYGLRGSDVMDQKAATLLGRLCLQGSISAQQWQAGEDWAQLVNAVHAAINGPRDFRNATPGTGAPLSDDDDASREQSRRAKLNAANNAIADRAPVAEQKERFQALRQIVIDQIDVPQMHGVLRTALNGLVRHFGLAGR